MSFNEEPRIVIKYGLLFNSKAVVYSDYGTTVEIPPYEPSDGPTLNFFTKMFFSPREFLMGAEAAVVHDYMCRHRKKYDRKTSSKMLRDIWIAHGLNPIKGYLVYYLVNIYQWIKHRHEWKS